MVNLLSICSNIAFGSLELFANPEYCHWESARVLKPWNLAAYPSFSGWQCLSRESDRRTNEVTTVVFHWQRFVSLRYRTSNEFLSQPFWIEIVLSEQNSYLNKPRCRPFLTAWANALAPISLCMSSWVAPMADSVSINRIEPGIDCHVRTTHLVVWSASVKLCNRL